MEQVMLQVLGWREARRCLNIVSVGGAGSLERACVWVADGCLLCDLRRVTSSH